MWTDGPLTLGYNETYRLCAGVCGARKAHELYIAVKEVVTEETRIHVQEILRRETRLRSFLMKSPDSQDQMKALTAIFDTLEQCWKIYTARALGLRSCLGYYVSSREEAFTIHTNNTY